MYIYVSFFRGTWNSNEKEKNFLFRSILYYILYTSFVDYTSSTCSVCNVEQVVFFDTPQWTFPFVSLSNTYEITTRALETDNFGFIFFLSKLTSNLSSSHKFLFQLFKLESR